MKSGFSALRTSVSVVPVEEAGVFARARLKYEDTDEIVIPRDSKDRSARRERQWLMYAESYHRSVRSIAVPRRRVLTLSVIFRVMSRSVRLSVLKALPK